MLVNHPAYPSWVIQANKKIFLKERKRKIDSWHQKNDTRGCSLASTLMYTHIHMHIRLYICIHEHTSKLKGNDYSTIHLNIIIAYKLCIGYYLLYNFIISNFRQEFKFVDWKREEICTIKQLPIKHTGNQKASQNLKK